MSVTDAEIIAALIDTWRPITFPNRARSCIPSALYAVAGLKEFGITAHAEVVEIAIENAEVGLTGFGTVAAWDEDGVGGPRDQTQATGAWVGHMVAVTRNEVLIDLAAGSWSRPQHSIVLPTAIAAPLEAGVATWHGTLGETVVYRLFDNPPPTHDHTIKHGVLQGWLDRAEQALR